MFFMIIWYTIGLLFFAWLIWKFLIQPILKDSGIKVEDEVTKYTKKLDKLRHEYDLMEKSTQAADEGVWLIKEIRKMEDKIKDSERKMREI